MRHVCTHKRDKIGLAKGAIEGREVFSIYSDQRLKNN